MFKSLNGLDLPANIISRWLEGVELLLDVIDDGRVLENRAVVREVDGLGLLGEDGHFAARIIIALLEGLKGSSSVTTQTELGSKLGPVELEGGAALLRELVLLSVIEGE